jgi:hypothetical protein
MSLPSREWIRPSKPLPYTEWPLTGVDRFVSQWVLQGTWIFDVDLDAAALKRGLGRLLDAYPFLCGRVAGGGHIQSTGEGVLFDEDVSAKLSVRDFGPTDVDGTPFGAGQTGLMILNGSAPLLAVKLTHVADGCVLSICCSHACLDGHSFYTMARNFGLATTDRPFPAPVFARRPVQAKFWRRPGVAFRARKAGWHRLTIVDNVRDTLVGAARYERRFVDRFSPEGLRRCKETLTRESHCDRLSTNSALVAHVAQNVGRLLDFPAGATFVVTQAMNQRGRVAGVPEHFAGNAASLVATAPIPAGAPAAEIASHINRRLEPLLAKPSPEFARIASLTEDVADHRLPYSAIPVSRMHGTRPTLVSTNSFSKFPIYDLDFGPDGRPARPIRTIPHNIGDGILVWPAPPSVGGIEIYFTGVLARAVAQLEPDDPWWSALRRFEREAV